MWFSKTDRWDKPPLKQENPTIRDWKWDGGQKTLIRVIDPLNQPRKRPDTPDSLVPNLIRKLDRCQRKEEKIAKQRLEDDWKQEIMDAQKKIKFGLF